MQHIELEGRGERGNKAHHVAWTDVDLSEPEDRDWLQTQSGLSESARTVLLEPVKISRRENVDDGLFVGFSSVAFAAGADEETPVSIGVLVERDRVITVRSEPLPVIEDLRRQVKAGVGPTAPLEFLASLVICGMKRLETAVTRISQDTDELEDLVLDDGDDPPPHALDVLRRRILLLRRHFVMSKSVVKVILSDPTMRLSQEEHEALKQASELVDRYVENLQDCRDRALLLHDNMERQLAKKAAKTANDLTIIATVFLPLTFVTGLLGMNVGGIPESHDPLGFWLVVGGLAALGLVSWVILCVRGPRA